MLCSDVLCCYVFIIKYIGKIVVFPFEDEQIMVIIGKVIVCSDNHASCSSVVSHTSPERL